MKEIIEYDDYRKYLSDWMVDRQKKNPAFSQRAMCQKAGFNSPNYLGLVISNKRNLSGKSVQGLIKGMKLTEDEAVYFKALIGLNQAKQQEDKVRYQAIILQAKSKREARRIRRESYKYLSHWLYPALREMIFFKDFEPSAEWVARHFKDVDIEQAANALKTLHNLGLLPDSKDKMQAEPATLATEDESSEMITNHFHRMMILKSLEAMEKTPPAKRDIAGVTVAIDASQMEEIKKLLQNFRYELNAKLTATENPNAVYQLNMQFFNLTDLTE